MAFSLPSCVDYPAFFIRTVDLMHNFHTLNTVGRLFDPPAFDTGIDTKEPSPIIILFSSTPSSGKPA